MILTKQATVELNARWIATKDGDDGYPTRSVQIYELEINMPLPGGKAVYTIPISQEMHDNMVVAQRLVEGKAK